MADLRLEPLPAGRGPAIRHSTGSNAPGLVPSSSRATAAPSSVRSARPAAFRRPVNLGAALVPVHILFWVQFDGGQTSSFNASFGGVNLDAFPLTNPAAGSTLYHFGLLASGTQTLAFSFRDDPGFINLDGVEVRIPEPATIALLAQRWPDWASRGVARPLEQQKQVAVRTAGDERRLRPPFSLAVPHATSRCRRS
jgi:hypothetical protein